jgi:GDP-L-fucose synthase
MVGMTLIRKLHASGYSNIITKTRSELDLLDQSAVAAFFTKNKPEYVFFAAGKTGGIYANNTYRADFIYENIMMQSNVIHQSFLNEVQRMIFCACSCIYPKNCPQPMNEDYLLSGKLEQTNEPFAIAKIAGLKMCEAYNRQYGTEFISVIPTNLYGPTQRYEPMNSMVVPSLMQKFHDAALRGDESVTIWGSGTPRRDFLYVDDFADACMFLMENYEGNASINIGTGVGHLISELADIIKAESGFKGKIVYDKSKPDGVPEKLQDTALLKALGWESKINLKDGIRMAYKDYLAKAKS